MDLKLEDVAVDEHGKEVYSFTMYFGRYFTITFQQADFTRFLLMRERVEQKKPFTFDVGDSFCFFTSGDSDDYAFHLKYESTHNHEFGKSFSWQMRINEDSFLDETSYLTRKIDRSNVAL